MQTSRRATDPMKILTRREMAAVLADLHRKTERSRNTRMNLVLFRLAACCGLRASEIASLQVGDVRTEGSRPHLRIRVGAAKGGRSRTVPLWWDAGTLAEITAWKALRLGEGAPPDRPFLISMRLNRPPMTFSRHTLRKRFRTACKILGPERLESLTIHHGRHTFISHALAGGRTLAEVRDAAGHSNVRHHVHVPAHRRGRPGCGKSVPVRLDSLDYTTRFGVSDRRAQGFAEFVAAIAGNSSCVGISATVNSELPAGLTCEIAWNPVESGMAIGDLHQ